LLIISNSIKGFQAHLKVRSSKRVSRTQIRGLSSKVFQKTCKIEAFEKKWIFSLELKIYSEKELKIIHEILLLCQKFFLFSFSSLRLQEEKNYEIDFGRGLQPSKLGE